LCAEVVGRNSGHVARSATIIKQKQLRVSPDVTGIGRNKERQISDQSHSFGMRIGLQLLSLAEEQELRERHLLDLIR
jgi:hypothetical protein